MPFPDPPNAVPGEGNLEDPDSWPQVGLLAHMGYRVGSKDPGLSRRRQILERVFRGAIPRVNSADYMREWGADETWPRLYKLAWSIATFGNNELRKKSGRSQLAITTWSDDLEWLRQRFYFSHFNFPWPSMDV